MSNMATGSNSDVMSIVWICCTGAWTAHDSEFACRYWARICYQDIPTYLTFGILSSVGDYSIALHYCFLVVGYLRLVHSDVPMHPLLGLQLYTLGDILTTQQGRTAEALHVFSLSYEVRRTELLKWSVANWDEYDSINCLYFGMFMHIYV